MNRFLLVSIALSVSGASTVPLQAQMIPGLQNMMIDIQHQSTMRQVSANSQAEAKRAPTSSRFVPSADQASASGLTYQPSKARRRANLANFVAKSRPADPQGAAEMETLFATTDVITALGRELAPYGLRTDNVADAYAAYWMSAWQAAHQDTDDPSRATAQAVKGQAANAISATPEFQDLTDAQKQEFAEALLVQAALISAAQAQYKDDPVMARKLATSVRQGAKATGIDLDATILTREGFVSAKRTGAADSAPGTEPQALSAADDAGSRFGYGFLAAAGDAGLGAAFLMGKASTRKG